MAIQNAPFTLFQDRGVETTPRSLRFDLNALADFEEATGMGFAQLLSTRAVFAATRAMLWAGLKHQQQNLTIQAVGQLIQNYTEAGGTIDSVLNAVINAAMDQGALPKTQEGEQGENPPKTDPTAKK